MLDEGTTMVGTHADNDLVLTDATVSRYHLEIRVRRDGIEIRDLDTTNGTKHGGARVGQRRADRRGAPAARQAHRDGRRAGRYRRRSRRLARRSVRRGARHDPADATPVRAAREGRADRGDDPAAGRDRHRQGSDRRGDPPNSRAQPRTVRRRRLRLDPARADRLRAVRPREGLASPAQAPTSRA